jgi:predicted O-methyltransferase YrrM
VARAVSLMRVFARKSGQTSAGAKKVLEIGTHSGGSARALARGMMGDRKIVTVDVNAESDADLAACPESGIIQKIVGDANSLDVIEQVQAAFSSVDMIYIDADHTALPCLIRLSVYSILLRPKWWCLTTLRLTRAWRSFGEWSANSILTAALIVAK